MKKEFNFSKEYFPTKNECMEILENYGTPKHVILHCNAVSETAKAIGKSLNNKGLDINIELVSSAGFLHDIARVHSKHDKVGAEYLRSIGLKNVAEVTQNHTKQEINPNFDMLTEVDVLCIADRVVLENKYVGPKKRMEYIKTKALKKYGPESEELLDNLIDEFVNYIANLEIYIGDSIYNIVPESIK